MAAHFRGRLLARLRAYFSRGATVRSAAERVGISKSSAHRLAQMHAMHRRSRLSEEQRGTIERLVREGKLSGAEISRLVGCGRSTVSLVRARVLDEQGPFRPLRRKQPVVCARGHATYFEPCVICGAEGLFDGEASRRQS